MSSCVYLDTGIRIAVVLKSNLYLQVLVREYGGLRKISSLATSNSQSVKLQALNVMNNLAIDIENQRFLKVCLFMIF